MGDTFAPMIGECLRAYRIHNEITVRSLAEIICVSPATISRIEAGKPVDQKTFMLLLDWLFS